MPESSPIDEMIDFIRKTVPTDLDFAKFAKIFNYGPYKVVEFTTPLGLLNLYISSDTIYITIGYSKRNIRAFTETYCTHDQFKTDHKPILDTIYNYHDSVCKFAQTLDSHFRYFGSNFGIEDYNSLRIHTKLEPYSIQDGTAYLSVGIGGVFKKLDLIPYFIWSEPDDYAHEIFEDFVFEYGNPAV